jgi:hypothetical protein
LINAPVFHFSSQQNLWSDVTRLCRRICLLRERGHGDEAEQLRTGPLADLMMQLSAAGENAAVIDEQLEKIFAVETERVADAAVLAELLAPLLDERAAARTRQHSESSPAAPHAAADSKVLLFDSPPPAPAAARRRSGDIADFLDEMIALERSPERARP